MSVIDQPAGTSNTAILSGPSTSHPDAEGIQYETQQALMQLQCKHICVSMRRSTCTMQHCLQSDKVQSGFLG